MHPKPQQPFHIEIPLTDDISDSPESKQMRTTYETSTRRNTTTTLEQSKRYF
jgi:hypothetical protein